MKSLTILVIVIGIMSVTSSYKIESTPTILKDDGTQKNEPSKNEN